MSITDELREWAKEFWEFSYSKFGDKSNLIAIADRIDAEYQEAVTSVMNDALYYANDKDMAECGWIRLPKDADGEVIHVGDAMERGDAHGCVIALMLSNYPKKWGGGLHWSIQLEGEQAPTALDLMFHHYHEPTVEDVMVEFAIDWESAQDAEDKASVLKEYAKRLKLAGEDA